MAILSTEAKRRIAQYLACKAVMEMTGATRAGLEEVRSYAVEALTQILVDNADESGYAFFRKELEQQQAGSAA